MEYISNIRKYIGHAPIMCTAATAIIYNKDGKILMERRSDNGKWCHPGGAIELGEKIEDGLYREVEEETSLKIKNPKLFAIYSGEDEHMIYPNGDEVYYTNIVYKITEFTGDMKFDDESQELKFFSLEEMPTNVLASTRNIIKDLKKEKNNPKAPVPMGEKEEIKCQEKTMKL